MCWPLHAPSPCFVQAYWVQGQSLEEKHQLPHQLQKQEQQCGPLQQRKSLGAVH